MRLTGKRHEVRVTYTLGFDCEERAHQIVLFLREVLSYIAEGLNVKGWLQIEQYEILGAPENEPKSASQPAPDPKAN